MAAVDPDPSAAATDSANSFSRVVGVLFSPKPTFESIARRPSWIVPVILGCLFFIAIVLIFTHRGGWPSFFEKQAASSSRMQRLSTEQRQGIIDKQIQFAPAFGCFESVVVPFLSALIVAALLLVVFNLSGAAKVNFKTSLGIVAYAWVPWLVHGTLTILILFLKEPATVDLQNPVASNPGAVLPDDTSKWLVALLSSVDIFAIWTMILLAIGFSAAYPKKLSFGKAFALVAISWIFFVAIKVGIVAAFS
ncbi:MAG: YIP1 family protein [Candidatus Acidiferrales bacterium]